MGTLAQQQQQQSLGEQREGAVAIKGNEIREADKPYRAGETRPRHKLRGKERRCQASPDVHEGLWRAVLLYARQPAACKQRRHC